MRQHYAKAKAVSFGRLTWRWSVSAAILFAMLSNTLLAIRAARRTRLKSETAVRSETELIRRLRVDTVGCRFRAERGIGGSFGGAAFSGVDLTTGRPVFIKYLICPRGEFERAKFLMERDALRHIAEMPGDSVAPKVLHFEEFAELKTMALVTEMVNGELLSNWLERANTFAVEQQLTVFHRIVVAMSKATLLYQHRDFHPGNIMLLPDHLVRMGPGIEEADVCSAVKVLDWGEALPVIMGNYDDEPNHNFLMLAFAPRTIGGALTSLPPEVFSPWKRNRYIGGTYESWGLGLLLYRVLTQQPLTAIASLGGYASDVHSGALRDVIDRCAATLHMTDLPGGLILPRLFKWIMAEEPELRAQISDIGRVMWDLRYEELHFEDHLELEQYFANPYGYEPEHGWKYSGNSNID